MEYKVEQLAVQIHPTREAMGQAAARLAAEFIRARAKDKDEVNVLFAAAPSQNEFLAALTALPEIPWERVNAFQLDEYIGLPKDAPQRFSRYVEEHVVSRVPLRRFYAMDPSRDPAEECRRYAALLAQFPPDLACIGIGENGHIAFNDPPVADFADPLPVKVVELDLACRLQQVNDGCFATLDDTPSHAVTLTIPTILAAKRVVCVVPGERKQEAVYKTLLGPIDTQCPASILRRHPGATLVVDEVAARLYLDEVKELEDRA